MSANSEIPMGEETVKSLSSVFDITVAYYGGKNIAVIRANALVSIPLDDIPALISTLQPFARVGPTTNVTQTMSEQKATTL